MPSSKKPSAFKREFPIKASKKTISILKRVFAINKQKLANRARLSKNSFNIKTRKISPKYQIINHGSNVETNNNNAISARTPDVEI